MLARLTRVFPAPAAVKVPEITVAFWVVKLTTTFMGEATSDWWATTNKAAGAVFELALIGVGLWLQFRSRRYSVVAYWFLAMAIACLGTAVSDTLHLVVGLSYGTTSALWIVVLAAVFVLWYRTERTLSIHSITTTRRECFYWSTVFATFALGTALGDYTATVLRLGYGGSGLMFFGIILVPLVAWRLGADSVAMFWFAYVITRPLGASFADYFGKSHGLSGLGFGDGPTAVGSALVLAAMVALLALRQQPALGLAPEYE